MGGFTAGSIPFAASGGTLTQDNAALFWDAANDRLGLGLATPATRLHASLGGGAPTLASAAATVAVFQNFAAAGDLARVSIISGTAGQSILQLGDSAADDDGAVIYDNGTRTMAFRVATTTPLQLGSNALGFIGTAPVTRPAAYTQTYATAARTHVETDANVAHAFNVVFSDVEVEAACNALGVRINEIKRFMNQILDDLQAYGLLA